MKDVRLTAIFGDVDFACLDKDKLKSFFDTFQDSQVDLDNLPTGIRLFTADESVVLEYTLNRVMVQIRQKAYKSFENMMELLSVAKRYLQILGISEVRSLSISKFNELKYNNSEGKYRLEDIMSIAFKNNLMQKIWSQDIEMKDLTRWEKSISMADDESHSQFVIECGFQKKDAQNLSGSLTLKTLIESKAPVRIDDLADRATAYNQILDNAFHWCISDKIIQLMKGHE